MGKGMKLSELLLIAIVGGFLFAGVGFFPSASADDLTTDDEVNLSSDQIAKLRGFQAENHYVSTPDAYIINVVRILPVKRTSKRPVIFNHGSTQSSTYFMTNSVNARPVDYTNLSLSSMNGSQLEQLLIKDPQSKCMPLLLASFGHEVWLINRRGTEYSLGRVGDLTNGSILNLELDFAGNLTSGISSLLTTSISSLFPSGLVSLLELLFKPQINLASIPNTFDASYWNFSLDEQAKYDLPAVITYVLNKTNSDQVAYVGHSLGNGVMFMLQSEHPEWAQKVEPFLAWSPDFYLGHTTSILRPLLVLLQPLLSTALIPFPPTPIDPLTRTLLATLCQTKLAQKSVCLLFDELQFGFSGLQETLPAFVASQFYSVSSHEAVQLAQDTEKGKMHHYDYGSVSANTRAYGQSSAPIYNVSRITSNSISLWRGEQDSLATPTDVDILKGDLKVSIDDRYIRAIPFAHYDLLFGSDVSNLVNIPSLVLIESYDN